MPILSRCLIAATLATASLCSQAQSFPVVSAAVQSVRDDDRHRILQDELAEEQDALTKARTAADRPGLSDIETRDARTAVTRHEKNIQSLQAEIGRLASALPSPKTTRAYRAQPARQSNAQPVREWDTYHRRPEN